MATNNIKLPCFFTEYGLLQTRNRKALQALESACNASGLAEVPDFMRYRFCRGHLDVPLDALAIWSRTVKEGDQVVFLMGDGLITFGLWEPVAKELWSPLQRQWACNIDEFMQLWAEAQKQAASYGVA